MKNTIESKTRYLFMHVALSGLYKGISMIIGLLLVPVTLKLLGNDSYGIWAAILNIINWISAFDLGLGNGLRNKLTEAVAHGDENSAREYIATAYIIASIISIIGVGLVLIVFPVIDWQHFLNIYNISRNRIMILMIVTVSLVVINLSIALCNSIFYAIQKASLTGLSQVVSQILSLMFIYLMKLVNDNDIIMWSSLYVSSIIIANIILSAAYFKKNVKLLPKLRYFKKNKIRDLFAIGIKFFLMQVATMILFSSSNFLVMKLYNSNSVTLFSIINRLFVIPVTLYAIIISPFWSGFTDAWVRNDLKWIKKTIYLLIKIWLGICAMSTVLAIAANPIIHIWIGKSYNATSILLITNLIYVYISTFNMIFSSFLNGIGKINVSFFLSIISGLLYIPIVYKVVPLIGTSGVIAALAGILIISSIVQPIQSIYIIKFKGRTKILDRIFIEI